MRLPLRKAVAIFDRLTDVLAYFMAAVIPIVGLCITYAVSMRYVFNRPPLWTTEVCEYSFVIIAFLAATWVLKGEGHVRLEILLALLKPRRQALANTITSIVAAITCLIIAWYGVLVTWDNFVSGQTFYGDLRVPKAPIVSVIPIGCFLLFIQLIRRAYGNFRLWRS